jgi:hypothetical protein
VSREFKLRAREAVRTGLLVWRVLSLTAFLMFAVVGAVMVVTAPALLADGAAAGNVMIILGLGLLYLFSGLDELRLFLNWLRGRSPRFRP